MKTVRITERQFRGTDSLYCLFFECPACEHNYVTRFFNFCPHCGARLIHVLSAEEKQQERERALYRRKYAEKRGESKADAAERLRQTLSRQK